MPCGTYTVHRMIPNLWLLTPFASRSMFRPTLNIITFRLVYQNKFRNYVISIANTPEMLVLHSAIGIHLLSGAKILSLNMLNCFKDYKRHNHILNHILDLAWSKLMKLILEQQCILFVLHSQYHACRCAGNFRNQGTNRHGIDPQ